MTNNIEEKVGSYIPLDKSWVIRMGFLDLFKGYNDIASFLDKQENLGGDLIALDRVVRSWPGNGPLDVGESGTIYRIARFYLWKNNSARNIFTSGTLTERSKEICQNSEIVNWHPDKLLKLDNKTTQWATASYLCGNKTKSETAGFKLKVTYDAVEHWEQVRKEGKAWKARPDPTIFNQAMAYLQKRFTGNLNFIPQQAEDYCFARAFDIMAAEEGRAKYPSLEGHETKRIGEMERAIKLAKQEGIVDSKDHRVVQAMAMLYLSKNQTLIIKDKSAVNKTWPLFWDFIDYSNSLTRKDLIN